MSSMRNAVQRRSHRERGQLKEREKLGLLEKNKDYKLRAADHKKKQKVLKSLKAKASERNEDEFYFGMLSRGKLSADKLSGGKKWTGTVAGDRGNTAFDVDTVRLLKTQDLGYLRTMRNVASKEVKQLEQQAVITGALAGIDANQESDDDADLDSEDEKAPRRPKPQSGPKKIIFAHSIEELEDELPESEEESDVTMSEDDFEKFEKEKESKTLKREENAERLQRKLRNAKRKLKALADAENELELQRARMAKTATVGGIAKNGKKIKVRERKR